MMNNKKGQFYWAFCAEEALKEVPFHPDAQFEYAACWAHAQRKFHEASNESPLAAQTLFEIRRLYRIEAERRDHPKQDRRTIRQQKSLPILAASGSSSNPNKSHTGPKAKPVKPSTTPLSSGTNLLIYTEHAQVEIDSNLVENAIRPTAIGKKNGFFFGSAEAGRTSAILYTLLETYRKLELNPDEYLRDILPRLPHMTNHAAPRLHPFTMEVSVSSITLLTEAKWWCFRNLTSTERESSWRLRLVSSLGAR